MTLRPTLLTLALALTLAAASAQAAPPAAAAEPDAAPFFARPFLFGLHRGGADWMPENTVKTFEEAARRWPHALLETDVRMTKDGVLVLLHDETVDRTTDGAGPIAEMTLAEVKTLDAGYRFTRDDGVTFPYRGQGFQVATLEEARKAAPEARFLVEPKRQAGIAEEVARVVKALDAEDRVLLASFDDALMAELRALLPECATCYSYQTALPLMAALQGGTLDAYQPADDVLSLMRRMVPEFGLTPEAVQALQARGVKVQVHTLNTREEMERYLDWGVDSILTDRPELLEQVLRERGMWRQGGRTTVD